MGRHIKNPKIGDNSATGITIPTVTTAQMPKGVNGQILYNSTTSCYQVYNGSAWYNISESSKEKTITIDRFMGDGTTVTFGSGAASGFDLDGSTYASFSKTVNDSTDIVVFVGGVYQVPETNYTVSSQRITFGSAPPADDSSTSGHIITIIHGLHKLGE